MGISVGSHTLFIGVYSTLPIPFKGSRLREVHPPLGGLSGIWKDLAPGNSKTLGWIDEHPILTIFIALAVFMTVLDILRSYHESRGEKEKGLNDKEHTSEENKHSRTHAERELHDRE